MQHKLDEAIKEYQEALRLKPEDAQAHNNLGNALAEQGKLDEAIGHYREALRLNADNPEAHFNLGLALLRQGKREEARGTSPRRCGSNRITRRHKATQRAERAGAAVRF